MSVEVGVTEDMDSCGGEGRALPVGSLDEPMSFIRARSLAMTNIITFDARLKQRAASSHRPASRRVTPLLLR